MPQICQTHPYKSHCSGDCLWVYIEQRDRLVRLRVKQHLVTLSPVRFKDSAVGKMDRGVEGSPWLRVGFARKSVGVQSIPRIAK